MDCYMICLEQDNMAIIKASFAGKIMGYYSYSATTRHVFCDGDACIIAGTTQLMHSYLHMMLSNHKEEQDIVKKTSFGEIINGLEKGGAYAFDSEAYARFFSFAEKYGLADLPEPSRFFLEPSPTGLHFIRIQLNGG